MLGVGFEPTHLSIDDLKSPPLDHSGIPALKKALAQIRTGVGGFKVLSDSRYTTRAIKKICSQAGSNRRPSAHKTNALTN